MHKAIVIAATLAFTPVVPAMAQQQQPVAQGPMGQAQVQSPGIPLHLSPVIVREVQQGLSQMGYNPGIVNGVWSPETASALQAFQKANGIEPTGNIDIVTLRTLGVPRRALRAMIAEQVGSRLGERGEMSGGQLGEGLVARGEELTQLGERLVERGEALTRLGERLGERSEALGNGQQQGEQLGVGGAQRSFGDQGPQGYSQRPGSGQ